MWAEMFHLSYITITLNASHISSNVGLKIAFTDRATLLSYKTLLRPSCLEISWVFNTPVQGENLHWETQFIILSRVTVVDTRKERLKY